MPFLAPQNSFRTKIVQLHVMNSCVRGFHMYQDADYMRARFMSNGRQ